MYVQHYTSVHPFTRILSQKKNLNTFHLYLAVPVHTQLHPLLPVCNF
jgi:hypothetical protein